LFSSVARVVEGEVGRSTLGALATLATVFFGPLSVILAGVGPSHGTPFLLGIGGLAGLLGWWLRIWAGPRWPLWHLLIRSLVVLCLSAGTSASVAVLLLVPGGFYWSAILVLMVGAGGFLLLGSLAPNRPGPNNSSKPTPLRGAA
jgi:hypothetical protein